MAQRLIVMGVAGSGKSSVARALAERLGLAMQDGDDLHAPESVAKMRAGIALQDADRWPWLDRVGAELSQASHPGLVIACSALRKIYRDRIRAQAAPVGFIFLDGSFELIHARITGRSGHYMKPGLLQSQFDTLERPDVSEPDVIRLNVAHPIATLVDQAVTALASSRGAPPSA
jgi:carbohydrate kinase (thermoresistant glucokinase family)